MDNQKTVNELNPEQLEAATHRDGPLLILAGAGSGKTRVLTNRIAWLIDEQKVAPWHIMAITFTNKAAREMRERVERMVGYGSKDVHVATFHSTCVRILRRFIDRIGYDNSFDIYDTDDSKSLLKDICKQMQINTKLFKERMFLAEISHLKEELIDPAQSMRDASRDADSDAIRIASVYAEYQKRLKRCNALDFDDLISMTVRLFREHRDVLDYYQERWRYLMVDEYQDTNRAQFIFISLLAHKYRNLCVVGDDDQSIYRFRGADIGNILNFEKIFPETKVIRLEQNYRSTQNILNAANRVIANNVGRKKKRLWTSQGPGAPVKVKRFDDARSEAEYIVDDVARKKRQGVFRYQDSAVLYRTNAQSRAIEEQLLYENIPYTIVGGTNFYARREVKDILAYLRTISNSNDDIAVKRIINVPKRGIGQTSINRVDDYAQAHGMSFYDVARMADKVPGIGRGGLKIREFVHFIQEMKKKAEKQLPSELISTILTQTGYEEELRLEGTDEAKDRLGNLSEFINKAAAYETSFLFKEENLREALIDALPEELRFEYGDRRDSSAKSPEGFDFEYGDRRDSSMEFPEAAATLERGTSGDSGISEYESRESEISGTGVTGTGATGTGASRTEASGDEASESETSGPTLRGFLEEVSLVAEIDSFDGQDDRVVLMTLHAAKGLEFPNVYIAGMDEGLFPSYQSTMSTDPADIEEERRLCYVGITRAKEQLTLTGANMRMLRGKMDWFRRSRFLDELTDPGASQMQRRESRSSSASSSNSWRGPVKKTPTPKPFYLVNQAAPDKTAELGYTTGDIVQHKKFGRGVVQEIRDGGRDKEVKVDFEEYGVKKMFAGFAKLVKVDSDQ